MNKEHSATFIGHSECFGLSSDLLKQEIIKLIKLGITDFYSGGQGEFDRICARCVFDLKKQYPHIKNYLVIPYLTFRIFNKDIFDEVIYPEGFEKYHFKSAIIKRNRYLVENSLYAICFVNHSYGGAFSTFSFAKKKNVNIINLTKDIM